MRKNSKGVANNFSKVKTLGIDTELQLANDSLRVLGCLSTGTTVHFVFRLVAKD